jgi:hypothetical protein
MPPGHRTRLRPPLTFADLQRVSHTALGERRFRRARRTSASMPDRGALVARLQDLHDREQAIRGRIPLLAHESHRYAQHGEDGIIAAIFDAVGATDRRFVEVGASDGAENCTRALVEDGWSGLWIEGDRDIAARARTVVGRRDVEVACEYVDRDNIVRILEDHGTPTSFDLLVVDVDGNDYWILRSITSRFRPRVIVAEYNGSLGAGSHWVLPYDASHRWDETAHHGASLRALDAVARRAGYQLVACDSAGVNAFFVRSDLSELSGRTPHEAFVPPVHTLPSGHPFALCAIAPTKPLPDGEQLAVRLDWIAATTTVTGQGVFLVATIENRSSITIASTLPNPVRLTWNWIDGQGRQLHQWGRRCWTQPWSIAPGESLALPCRAIAPESAGEYELVLRLVQESVRWLDDEANASVAKVVTISE